MRQGGDVPGIVSFVGAGPGDPELITLKGLRRIREANVVIYDRLVPKDLLSEAPRDAELIDVGKTPGRVDRSQDDINWMLVDRGRKHGRVVRLKGGDPTIFGRLSEEIDAVRSAGLPFEIVPGVTAATAAAALAGISLTERGTASMVVLATGTDHTGIQPAALDWGVLVEADATLAFYMIAGALGPITSTLTTLGRDAREPAILVEAAGTVTERVHAGRLGEIAAVARSARVEAPTVMITGPTARKATLPLRLAASSANARL